MYIYQNENMFNFSLDSVLLPNFVTINKNTKRILDIGCGNGPIPLILSTLTTAKIDGVEIQKEAFDLAKKSVEYNKLSDRISLYNEDIKNFAKNNESDIYDVITCNPPYFKINDKSKFNESDFKTIARHEIKLNLEDVIKISKKLLKNNGHLAIVHRPDRLLDIITIMRQYNIEPKRIQLIYPHTDSEANILLVEGIKNGKSGLKVLAPLYSHDNNGEYTNEIKKYFEKRN